MKLQDCPPASFTFHYSGEESFTGEALEVFRCGMYLMLDYEGPLDNYGLLQDMVLDTLANDEVNPESLKAIIVLLTGRLVSLGEDFYDKAVARILQLIGARPMDKTWLDALEDLLESLNARGFPTTAIEAVPAGAKLLARIRQSPK